MTATDDMIDSTASCEGSGVEFGRSNDGLAVARIGDLAFAMVPGRQGEHFVASAWRVQRPLADLRRENFYSHHGIVADETEFRARMIEQAEHSRELVALGRQNVRINCGTPWGSSQGATIYAEGVVAHTRAGHGGFQLSLGRNAQVDAALRTGDGWYEEDDQWAVVAVTFPALFTTYERKFADRTFRDKWPGEWERKYGRVLEPGESQAKDREAFEREHAGDWVVVAAIYSDHHPNMVEAIAVVGGKQHHHAEERRFLVPHAEYADRGPYGFIIDVAAHAACEGPPLS